MTWDEEKRITDLLDGLFGLIRHLNEQCKSVSAVLNKQETLDTLNRLVAEDHRVRRFLGQGQESK